MLIQWNRISHSSIGELLRTASLPRSLETCQEASRAPAWTAGWPLVLTPVYSRHGWCFLKNWSTRSFLWFLPCSPAPHKITDPDAAACCSSNPDFQLLQKLLKFNPGMMCWWKTRPKPQPTESGQRAEQEGHLAAHVQVLGAASCGNDVQHWNLYCLELWFHTVMPGRQRSWEPGAPHCQTDTGKARCKNKAIIRNFSDREGGFAWIGLVHSSRNPLWTHELAVQHEQLERGSPGYT